MGYPYRERLRVGKMVDFNYDVFYIKGKKIGN